jgi:3-oxoadipate enol-lactonase
MPSVKVGDVNLFYESDGIGEPLIFLHGLGSSTLDWGQQIPAFIDRYRVIVIDMRGHGQSDKPPGPYSIQQFTDDLVNLMNTFRVGSAHVVGISMGGMIAFQLATQHPSRVKTLIIVNSGPEVKLGIVGRLGAWLRFVIVRLMGMRKMGETLAGRLFPQPDQASVRQTFIERWAKNDPRAYLDSLRAILRWPGVAKDLDKIQVPTLILASEYDYTSVASKQAYAKKIPNAQVQIIPGARHAVPAEKPQEFNKIVRAFIDDHTDRRITGEFPVVE